MKNKTTKQGCAGNCAGKSSNNGFKTPKFQRVKDSKGKPIRGVWIRGKQFYARLFIDNGSGQKIDRRVPLEAKTVQDARRELEQLKFLGKTSNLSIRQSQPFNSFRDHYLDSIANMKRKRTFDSENQHLKQWSAFFGNLPIHQISREKIIKYRILKIKGGWTGHTDGYHVEDGILVCKAGGLLLFTETQYTDFVLRFDFQLTPGANSGIGIRYAPPFQPLQDIEIQILDNSAKEYKDLGGKHRHGAIYSVAAAKPGHLRRVGQWNSQTIAVQGSRITVTLNGEVILDKRLDEFNLHPDMQRPRGHIAILGHGTPMKFRKIGVKELTAE